MQNKKIKEIKINCEPLQKLNDSQSLDLTKILQFLGEQLNFPDYYGQNLDAFIDCFAEFGEQYAEQKIDISIELVGLEKILSQPNKKLSAENIQDLLATLDDATFSRNETFADLGEFSSKIIVN